MDKNKNGNKYINNEKIIIKKSNNTNNSKVYSDNLNSSICLNTTSDNTNNLTILDNNNIKNNSNDNNNNNIFNINTSLKSNKDYILKIINSLTLPTIEVIEEFKKSYSTNNYNKLLYKQSKHSFYKVFNSQNVVISIEDYVYRLVYYNELSISCVVYAYILLDRIIINNDNFILTYDNIHKLIYSCFIISLKFNHDDIYEDADYANLGGIDLQTYSLLQISTFELLNCDAFIDTDSFNEYIQYLLYEYV